MPRLMAWKALCCSLVVGLFSGTSTQVAQVKERSIAGRWIVEGNQPHMATALVTDTVDWAGLSARREKDILMVGSDIDQEVVFRSDGSGFLRDKRRGKVQFLYHLFCDTSRTEYSRVDSAGYYVEGGPPLVPCELRIWDATYSFLWDRSDARADSIQLSRQTRVGTMVVAQTYFMMRRGRK